MKNIFISAFTYIFAIVTFFLGSALALVLVLFGMQRRKAFVLISKPWAKAVLKVAGVRITVTGSENLQFHGPKVIVSNHQGNFDIPILMASLPVDFRFLVKKELFNVPFFGWYIKNRGDISIDREKGQRAHQTLKITAELVKKGSPVLIFPEGTRSRDGKLGVFKRGGLVLAYDAEARLVPVGINGSYNIQKKGGLLIGPARVTVNIGRPIDVIRKECPEDGIGDEKMASVREAIFSLMGSGQR